MRDDILASLSLAASPFTTPGQANDYSSVTATPFYRTANSGNFTLYGATGADANAHAIHLQTDGQFFAELNLMSKNYTVAGVTIADDIGVSSNVSFTGTVSASTINGQVQLPRRGGEHLFTINDSTPASDLTINGRVWGVGTTFVKLCWHHDPRRLSPQRLHRPDKLPRRHARTQQIRRRQCHRGKRPSPSRRHRQMAAEQPGHRHR